MCGALGVVCGRLLAVQDLATILALELEALRIRVRLAAVFPLRQRSRLGLCDGVPARKERHIQIPDRLAAERKCQGVVVYSVVQQVATELIVGSLPVAVHPHGLDVERRELRPEVLCEDRELDRAPPGGVPLYPAPVLRVGPAQARLVVEVRILPHVLCDHGPEKLGRVSLSQHVAHGPKQARVVVRHDPPNELPVRGDRRAVRRLLGRLRRGGAVCRPRRLRRRSGGWQRDGRRVIGDAHRIPCFLHRQHVAVCQHGSNALPILHCQRPARISAQHFEPVYGNVCHLRQCVQQLISAPLVVHLDPRGPLPASHPQ
mmetsp:Transcript_7756/g.23472  ORF Transcript_7756/g.23472 Transcript_7756/m.23472 type:complete len:316 (+) Transcript_7756:1123-2070(+)